MDNESSIFKYNIGLGSNSASNIPDIVPFASTAGPSEYVVHHPDVAQGTILYLVLEAVNKAQLVTTKVNIYDLMCVSNGIYAHVVQS